MLSAKVPEARRLRSRSTGSVWSRRTARWVRIASAIGMLSRSSASSLPGVTNAVFMPGCRSRRARRSQLGITVGRFPVVRIVGIQGRDSGPQSPRSAAVAVRACMGVVTPSMVMSTFGLATRFLYQIGSSG